MSSTVEESQTVPAEATLETTKIALDSNNWLIRASGLRKKYCRDLRRSLWYSLVDVFDAFGHTHENVETLREHEFWAVDDISFELRRGDSLGLLGRNGAGKSTLIKLVTGQRSLTAGTVETRGRVVALTELGLGFDPVLTGRENAYVNAAVHGVSRREFEKIIEKIIEFSELREFIDSAVHTYSSGMKARLGFSVATHLSPDILIVDEVLAVGDLEFRRKCVKHIIAYLNQGGSIMLVAHDPYLVQSICNRAIVMERGRVLFDGSALEGVDLHFRMGHANQYAEAVKDNIPQASESPATLDTGIEPSQPVPAAEDETAPRRAAIQAEIAAGNPYLPELSESRTVSIDRISILPLQGDTLITGQPARVSLHYRSKIASEIVWAFTLCTRDLQVNIASGAIGFGDEFHSLQQGENVLTCMLPKLILQAGVYAIRGGIADASTQSPIALFGYEDSPHFFTVHKPLVSKESNLLVMMDNLVQIDVEWHPQKED